MKWTKPLPVRPPRTAVPLVQALLAALCQAAALPARAIQQTGARAALAEREDLNDGVWHHVAGIRKG